MTAPGGRKYSLSVLGVLCVTLMAILGATTGEAFIAIGTIVLSFCGGNAAIEWRHAGASRTERATSESVVRQEIIERRALGGADDTEPV